MNSIRPAGHGLARAALLSLLVAAGCASSPVRVTRTPWTQSHRGADTTVVAAAPPAPARSTPPPARSMPPSGETVAVDMTPPLDTARSDSFDTTFVSPGRIEEVSEKEILGSAPRTDASSAPGSATAPPSGAGAEASTGASGTRSAILAPGQPSAEDTRDGAPPRPGASSTPAAPLDSTAVFVVQLYAAPTREAAEFAARQIARQLGRTTRVRELRPASMPFKVVAGQCADRPCADSLRSEAVGHGYVDAWVTSVPAGELSQLFEARPGP